MLEAHLDRIDAVNGLVNAVVERVDRDTALAAPRRRTRPRGTTALPLDGVPVAIKDHFDVEGMLHTEGIRAFADRRSPGNSAAVQRLLDAGAFIVGKCNQPDFQIRWNTVNDLYGATRNPRDTSLTAGGSSGGDAAAVATGMAALGLGADYGGSIRVPLASAGSMASVLRRAACPSPGARSRAGRNDPRPDELTRAVRPHLDDLWAAFVALAGPDPRDPRAFPWHRPSPASSGRRPRCSG